MLQDAKPEEAWEYKTQPLLSAGIKAAAPTLFRSERNKKTSSAPESENSISVNCLQRAECDQNQSLVYIFSQWNSACLISCSLFQQVYEITVIFISRKTASSAAEITQLYLNHVGRNGKVTCQDFNMSSVDNLMWQALINQKQRWLISSGVCVCVCFLY